MVILKAGNGPARMDRPYKLVGTSPTHRISLYPKNSAPVGVGSSLWSSEYRGMAFGGRHTLVPLQTLTSDHVTLEPPLPSVYTTTGGMH